MTIIQSCQKPAVVLPACSYPNANADGSRETALIENIEVIRSIVPNCRIIVGDNGLFAPKLPDGVELIHSPMDFSKDPSTGECRNIINALATLKDDTQVIKLHARCHLVNINAFQRYLAANPEFMLLSRNYLGRSKKRYDTLPYIDTRVMAARSSRFQRLTTIALETIQREGGRFEQAMLSAVMRSPDDCEILSTRGSFFPILSGISGHGRDYNNPLSRARATVKSLSYRIGL